MRAVAASWLPLLGNFLPSRKFLNVHRIHWLPSSTRLLRQAGDDRGPLTLENLGFMDESEPDCWEEDPNSSVGSTKNKFKKSPSELNVKSESDTMRRKNMGEGWKLDSNYVKSKYKVKPVVRSKPKGGSMPTNPLEIEGAPFAAKSFSELNVPPLLIERLEKEGFKVPTEVQSAVIPMIAKGHDVVIQSYTGSGKTLAYVLPILSEVDPFRCAAPDTTEPILVRRDIDAVIVAPSRELGMQIVREFEKLLGPTDKRQVQQLIGGANRSRQEEALKKNKPSIVVGTPGRIAEISRAGKLHTHCTRYLVLDEVDELLSSNFRMDLHRILEHVGKMPGGGPSGLNNARRIVMVSATVPFSVVRAGQSWAHNPLLVRADSVGPLESVVPRPVSVSGPVPNSEPRPAIRSPAAAVVSLPPNLKHYYCISRFQHRIDALRRCVHALNAQSVIAFLNHSRRLKDVVYKLRSRGLEAAELHGDIGKLGRSTTLRQFKNGEVRVLVTNELSARGLDVAECDLVVNLEMPTDSTHYAHRAGRTGRLGRKGNVVSICEEGEVFVVKKLQKQLGVPISACDFAEGKLNLIEDEAELILSREKDPRSHFLEEA